MFSVQILTYMDKIHQSTRPASTAPNLQALKSYLDTFIMSSVPLDSHSHFYPSFLVTPDSFTIRAAAVKSQNIYNRKSEESKITCIKLKGTDKNWERNDRKKIKMR